jgi:hypothetical protein
MLFFKLIRLGTSFAKTYQTLSLSSSRWASFLQRDSTRLFQKLLRMFLNAFALRLAPNRLMSLMQELLSNGNFIRQYLKHFAKTLPNLIIKIPEHSENQEKLHYRLFIPGPCTSAFSE